MGKGLSKGMIDMYIEMAEKEYQPLIQALKAKTAALEPQIETQVKKDFGIYDLLAEQEALKIRLKELEEQLSDFVHRPYRPMHGGYGKDKIETEVERRLTEMNTPLTQVLAAKESALKQIKLMAAGDDVKLIFENMAKEIEIMANDFKALPDVITERQKQLAA